MQKTSALDLALGTGPVVQFVLVVLILASVFSWAIIFAKWMAFRNAKKESDHFLDLFWNAKSLDGIFAETKISRRARFRTCFARVTSSFKK